MNLINQDTCRKPYQKLHSQMSPEKHYILSPNLLRVMKRKGGEGGVGWRGVMTDSSCVVCGGWED